MPIILHEYQNIAHFWDLRNLPLSKTALIRVTISRQPGMLRTKGAGCSLLNQLRVRWLLSMLLLRCVRCDNLIMRGNAHLFFDP